MEKLRNKNTGVIVKFLSLELVDEDEIEFTYELPSGHEKAWSYSSLEKFKEEWEIYKPAEPLIKDSKIRKAVRAWAEINDICGAEYGQNAGASWFVFKDYKGREMTNIGFLNRWALSKSENGKAHTITELCGEEEE